MKKKATIFYKSGTKLHIKVDELTVTRYTSGALSIKWSGLEPPVFHLGVDDVESIWEGHI